ncbi:MAG TPA: tRNA 2-thiouridine(34) synthase MnmA [Polyangiaceae bacterium]|jgi:tRNA-specific 2-thiouridylase
MAERVLVAMSGGVDSSVAAARLVAQGHEVVGATLHLWDYPDDGSVRGRCCAPEDVRDAARAADALGIPHYAFDRREIFRQRVVDPFVEAYLTGETPSPCVRCNRSVKTRELLGLADRLGASAVATGHYARTRPGSAGAELWRARDRDKDQSYFLHMLGPAVLERLRFPLGDATKAEVREEAEKLGLPGAGKGESQELCFVPTGRYDRFVAERAGDRLRPGPIVDEGGREVGRHEGVHGFTIGQRKNLGVALGRRAYVVGIDAGRGRVELGSPERLAARGAVVASAYLHPSVELPCVCSVAVRYRAAQVPAAVEARADGRLLVGFQTPVNAVVPGQYAVFYDGDRVLGGGVIERPVPALEQGAEA